MPGLFSTPIPPEDLAVDWTAREVVVDLLHIPHLLRRLTITGPHFPHRAEEPFVRVGNVRSRFVRISPDGMRADAYFDTDLPNNGEIVFGHRDTVELILRNNYADEQLVRLDRTRIPKATRFKIE